MGRVRGLSLVKGVRFLPENKLKLRTLSEDEEARLLPCTLYLHDIVLFALHTGLRSGGLFELKWEDINTREQHFKFIAGKTQRELEFSLTGGITAILQKWQVMKRHNALRSYELQSQEDSRDGTLCENSGIEN